MQLIIFVIIKSNPYVYLHVKTSSSSRNFLSPNITPYKQEYETFRSSLVKFCMIKVYPLLLTFPSYFLLGFDVLRSINSVRCSGEYLSQPASFGQQFGTLQNNVTFCPKSVTFPMTVHSKTPETFEVHYFFKNN